MNDLIIEIALLFFGTRYKYAGNTILSGMDCSGFVSEVLRSVGIIGKSDYSSQMLYDYLKDLDGFGSRLGKGSILFFGPSRNKIIHTAIAINSTHMIEAGGGNSETDDFLKAIKRNAYIRIRPIKYRKDFLTCLKWI